MQGFLSRISVVPSINMLNFAILELTNAMTPIEAMQVYQETSRTDWRFEAKHPRAADKVEAFTQAVRHALSKIVLLMRAAGKPKLERFVRSEPVPGIKFFTDGTGGTDKSLLICFAGNGGRMMMPLPAFLQHIDARQADVVLLADPMKQGFRNGISGIAPNIIALVEQVSRVVPAGYRDIKVMGTSAGGIPALLVAAHSSATRVLAIGAGQPDDDRWPLVDGLTLRQMLADAAPKLAGKHIVLAYGVDSSPDPEAAEALKEIIPNATPLAVSLEGKPAEHSFLADLGLEGRLAGFLADNLAFENK
jgi:hypothetical protein